MGTPVPVPACLRLQDDVFPRVRSHAARRLVAAGWSQSRTAAFLGVSQAMVSKYANRGGPQARPADGPTDGAQDEPLVVRLAEDLVQEALAPTPVDGPSPWCTTLTAAADPQAGTALQDLLEAERRLRAEPPLRVMPQIGMNLVRALPEAQRPAQVLGYPARIVRSGDRILPPAPPMPGASDHLARCLLALRRVDPSVQALGSLRGGADVRAALCDETVAEMAPGEDRTAAFEKAVTGRPASFIHDPGAFGIEPCLYVAGRDAAAVARRIHDIHTRI